MTLDFRSVVQTCLLLTLGLSHAQSQAQVAPDPERLTMYRTMSCAMLRESDRTMEEDFRQGDALQPTPTGNSRYDRHLPAVRADWEQKKLALRAALAQALREKQCDKPQAAALPADRSRQATAAPVAVAPSAGGMLPQIGARVDVVSPGFAQSLGLRQPGGALVLDAEAGGPAQKAGLQSLDVITEITGQEVLGPSDLQESLSRMRPGFKASLRVWRNKAMRDVVVEIAEGPPVVTDRPPPAALLLPPAAAPPAPVALPLQPTTAYCFARINDPPEPTVQSALYETPSVNGAVDYVTAKADLIDFQQSLLDAGDKRFRPFPPEKAFCGAGNCVGIVEGGLFTSRQNTVVICKMSRAAAEQLWKQSLPGTEAASWKPKR